MGINQWKALFASTQKKVTIDEGLFVVDSVFGDFSDGSILCLIIFIPFGNIILNKMTSNNKGLEGFLKTTNNTSQAVNL